MRNSKFLLSASLVCFLAACSSGKDDDIAQKPPESAEKLYSDARTKVDEENYKEAIKTFEEVERQHPYSSWATNAQVMSAYSSYEMEDYDSAVSTLERFVKLYPDNESTPYAYYLISMCYYDQISDVGRDQKITEQALVALREVVRRFPDSNYARDAKIKLDLTLDHLAGKEMQVGRYYLKRDDTLAAVNRFRYVVENYQTTSHTPEALHRLVEAYLKLGVTEEAKRYAAVLGHNFPNSLWYRDSYKLMTNAGIKQDELGKKTADIPPKSSSWWEHII
ncbi:MAG: outer membrane protein assembly factor BamD [Rickettsiales bacterium]